MNALRAPVFLLCIFAAVVIVSVAQSEGDGREVVQASEILEKIERGELVNYANKIIVGNLNIDTLKLSEIPLRRKVIRSQINLDNCLIKGDLDFSNAFIQEPISFYMSTISERADFSGSRFNQSADFWGTNFNQYADFSLTNFNHSAAFGWTNFNQYADFWGSNFNQSADFSLTNFNQSADFWGSNFNQSADFWGSNFNHYAYFGGVLFNQSTGFVWTNFNHDADFGGVEFNQSADFWGTNFNRSASFKNANFDLYADFSSAIFNNITDFSNAKFSGPANFSSEAYNKSESYKNERPISSGYSGAAKFKDAAYFWNVTFKSSADFSSASFDSTADFWLANFSDIAGFSNSQFRKECLFDRTRIKSANFEDAGFSGPLSFENSKIERLNLKNAEIKEISLSSWNSTIGHMEYDESAYLLILSYFRNNNLLEDANECYYDYRDARRSNLKLLYQPVDYLLMLFYGYSVKPERPVYSAFAFISFFALIFWWRQGIMPIREGEPEEEANRFTLLEALAFSGMTFLSGGKLVFDPPEYRISPGKPWRDVQICKALFVWERLMGMILIVMFAIAVSKTIILS